LVPPITADIDFQDDSTLEGTVTITSIAPLAYEATIRDRYADDVYVFGSAGGTTAEDQGRLIERTTRQWKGASKVGFTYHYDAGKLVEIKSPRNLIGDTPEYSIDFSYTGASLIDKVQVKQGTTVVQEADYTYHGDVDSGIYASLGSDKDLVQVKVSKQASDGSLSIIRCTQYRYYTDTNRVSRVKAVYESDAIDRIINNFGITGSTWAVKAWEVMKKLDSETAGGKSIADFASRSFDYWTSDDDLMNVNTCFGTTNEDLKGEYGGADFNEVGMVKRETVGGSCTSCGSASNESSITRDYYYLRTSQSGTTSNTVRLLVIEDTKDEPGNVATGSYRTIYGFEENGRMLRRALIENPSGTSPKFWCWSWKLSADDKYLLTEERMPRAHNVGTGTVADFLAGNDSSSTLKTNDGVIYVYFHDTNGNVTQKRVKKGSSIVDTSAPLVYAAEYSNSGNNLVTKEYDYPTQTATVSNGKATTYSYDYYSSDPRRIKTKTTTMPPIDAGQNGSGVESTMVEYFDTYGRLRWIKDGEGYVEYRSYHPKTGNLALRVRDVNPSSPGSDVTSGSAGNWDPVSEGGADTNIPTRGPSTTDFPPVALVDKTYFDVIGRPVLSIDPNDKKHATAYSNDRIITFLHWNGSTTSLLPIRVMVQADGVNVSEVFEVKAGYTAITVSGGRPTGFSTAPGQADYVSWTRHTLDEVNGELAIVDRYHDIPSSGNGTLSTNFHRSVIKYDGIGRKQYEIQVVSGTATSSSVEQVTEYVYDVRDRVIGIKKGVSKASGAGSDMGSNYSTYPSMQVVNETVYDNGGVGDGHVTDSRRFFGTGSNDYTLTKYHRDYRGFLRVAEQRTGSSINTISPYTVQDVDWKGRVIASADYKYTSTTGNLETTSTVSSILDNGSYAANQSSNRGSLNKTFFDDLGRVYKTERNKINFSDGLIQGLLVTQTYYDRRGLEVANGTEDGSFTETAYDGIGRPYQTRTVTSLPATASLWSSGAFQYRTPAPRPVLSSMSSGANNNVITMSHTEYSSTLTTGVHQFELNHDDSTGINPSSSNHVRQTAYMWYDGADRLTTMADYGSGDTATGAGDWKKTTVPTRDNTEPSGSTATALVTKYSYDSSSGLQDQVIDPKGTRTKTFFDRLGRATGVVENWDNTGTDISSITPGSNQNRVVLKTYNGLSSLVTLVAKNPATGDQTTSYSFEDPDFADRVTRERYPDYNSGASPADEVVKNYNLDGTLNFVSDQRGTTQTMVYNERRQLLRVQASDFGTADNHVQSIGRTYDALARVTKITSYANASGTGTPRNEIELAYDGLGNVISSKQAHEGAVGGTTPTVQYSYDTSTSTSNGPFTNNHRLQSVTYPNGRVVFNDYGTADSISDRLSRIAAIRNANSSGTAWSTYAYNGESRLARVDYPNTVRLDYFQGTSGTYAGYDRFGRIKDQRWDDTDATADADRYQYGYDEAGNRLFRDNRVATASGDWLYAYDTSHRLDIGSLGQLNSSQSALTQATLSQDWGLDALGNWGSLTQTGAGAFSQTRAHNAANEVSTATGWTTTAHDAVGNMTTMPQPASPASGYTCVYDAWNRLVKVSSGSTTVAEYEYDGLNRRIVKSLGTGTVKEHFYYNEEWQELEIRQENSGIESVNPREQFVWHPYYIDALATRFYDSDVNNSSGVVQHYFTHDANFNVTAALDTSGNVVERYDYSPYGEISYLDNAFGSITDTTIAHRRAYTGQRLDAETGLYQYRNRYYHARLGRFISRDPIGYDGSPWNLYEYVDSNPLKYLDAFGEFPNSIEGSIRACLAVAAKNPVAGSKCFKDLIQIFGGPACPQRKLLLCYQFYFGYKGAGANCRRCVKGMNKNVAAANAACFAAEITGRSTYLKMKCDYVLPGSISAGSGKQEAAHGIELANKTNAMVECTKIASP
jgi:RHS repeat-associated protein